MRLRLGRVKVPGRYVEFGGLRESVQTIRAGLVGLDRGVGCILYNDFGFHHSDRVYGDLEPIYCVLWLRAASRFG